MAPGSVAEGMVERPTEDGAVPVVLEHPTGNIDVLIDCTCTDDFDVSSVGLVRTARKLADGNLYIPASIWNGGSPD